jgi:cell division protein FtsB
MAEEAAQQPQQKRKTERKRTGQLSGLQVMFAAILAIGLILGLNFTSLVTSGQPLQELYNKVSGEIQTLKKEQADLITERDYARSDPYVEIWARNEGKMVRPGEVLVVPVPSGKNVEPTPVPQQDVAVETKPPQPDNWQVWWNLFFDTAPPKL